MKFHHKIMVGALGAGIVAWLGDALLDYFFFTDQFHRTLLQLLLTDVPPHELYFRILLIVLFLGFGYLISYYVRGLSASRKRVRHLNRVIGVIRHVNQLIIREDDKKELINRACELLIETGGYCNTFIILLDEEKNPVEAAQAGLDKSSAELLEDYKSGELATCSEGVIEQADPVINPEAARFCANCNLYGEHEGAVPAIIRLAHEGRIYGLLAVFIPEEFSQLEEKLDLLEEVAGDLSFAFASIEQGEKRREAERRLAKSRQNLKVTLNSIGDGLISTDTEGKVVRMNPVAEALTGWDFEAAEDKPLDEVFNIVNTDTGEPVDNPVEEVLASGKIVGLANHTTLISRTGEEYRIADSGAPIKGPGGEITGVVLVFRDITEKYEMREKIRRSEKRYRSLFNQMNEGVALHEIVYDESGQPVDYKFLEVNSQFEEILDLEREEVLEQKATEVYDTEEPPYFERYLAVAEAEDELEFETYFPPLDKHFHISAFAPEPGKFATVFMDITERKKTQAALEERHRQLQTLFGNLPGMAYRCQSDREWTMKFLSEGVRELTGYGPAELLESSEISYGDLIVEADRESVWNEVQSAVEQREPYELVYRIRARNGEEKWVWEQGEGVFAETGELKFLEGFITDITERHRMEKKLRDLLEEKEVMLQEIHHRVKNNLQVICSLLDMRARTAISEAEKPLMETRNRVNSMALIHDRIYQSDTPSAVNIENYLEELTAGLRNTYERGQQEIQVELEVDETIRLELDLAVPCALILNELLANVFEHAFPVENEKENIIRISFQQNSSEFDFCLRISDNGQGLPGDYEIGELGQRDTLGLGLVKALVEQQLAGELEVNSSPNKGTEFIVRF